MRLLISHLTNSQATFDQPLGLRTGAGQLAGGLNREGVHQERVLLNLLGFVGQHLEPNHEAPMAGLLLVRGILAVRDHVYGKVG